MTRYEPGNDLHRAMLEAFRKVFGDVSAHPIEMTRAVEQSGRFLSSSVGLGHIKNPSWCLVVNTT